MKPTTAPRAQRQGADGSSLASWPMGSRAGAAELDAWAVEMAARPTKMLLLGESHWALSPLAWGFYEKVWASHDQAFGQPMAPGKTRLGGQLIIASEKEIEALFKKSVARFKLDYAWPQAGPFKVSVKAAIQQARCEDAPRGAGLSMEWFSLSVFKLNGGLGALVTHQSRKGAAPLLSNEQVEELAPGSLSLWFGECRGEARPCLLSEMSDRLKKELREGAPNSKLSWMGAFKALDALFEFNPASLAEQNELADPADGRAGVVLACKALVEAGEIGSVLKTGGNAEGVSAKRGARVGL